MSRMKNLSDLFMEELRRVYDAEQRLVKALPKMAETAASPELRQAMTSHFEETEAHVDRIEQVFELMNEKPDAEKSEAIKGVIKEAEDMMSIEADDTSVRDAAMIAAAQEAEHLEIAAYGTLRTWAAALGKTDVMQILELTLEEEKSADRKLTDIAQVLNTRAAHAHAS